MSYPDETMQFARGLTEEVVRLASELLQAGADLAYVQTVYTIAAIEILSDAEALVVLAASGDQDAGAALDETLSQLAALRDRARLERPGTIRRMKAVNAHRPATRSDAPPPRQRRGRGFRTTTPHQQKRGARDEDRTLIFPGVAFSSCTPRASAKPTDQPVSHSSSRRSEQRRRQRPSLARAS
jgi:hypothetical protein